MPARPTSRQRASAALGEDGFRRNHFARHLGLALPAVAAAPGQQHRRLLGTVQQRRRGAGIDPGIHVGAAPDPGVIGLADGARTKAGAWPIGDAFIERSAEDDDIGSGQFGRIEDEIGAHERLARADIAGLVRAKWAHGGTPQFSQAAGPHRCIRLRARLDVWG